MHCLSDYTFYVYLVHTEKIFITLKGQSKGAEHRCVCTMKNDCKLATRPANSHGFTVRLTVWGINSRSHDLASKSHGESENLEIAKQFR